MKCSKCGEAASIVSGFDIETISIKSSLICTNCGARTKNVYTTDNSQFAVMIAIRDAVEEEKRTKLIAKDR